MRRFLVSTTWRFVVVVAALVMVAAALVGLFFLYEALMGGFGLGHGVGSGGGVH
jgi:hypothetical protein